MILIMNDSIKWLNNQWNDKNDENKIYVIPLKKLNKKMKKVFMNNKEVIFCIF